LRLPWTGEFTPGQLGAGALRATLDIVAAADEPRRASIVEAIRRRWFSNAAQDRDDPVERLEQQRVRAGNVLNRMQNYGLVTPEYELTSLGVQLLAEPGEDDRSARFVAFLLKQKHGLDLLGLVRDLRQRGVSITKATITSQLRRQGYSVSTNNADAGKLRQ